MRIKKLLIKIIAACTLVIAAASLFSCSMIPGYAEPEEQAIVSAIGFDADGELLTVTIQLAESENEKNRTVSGSGRSIESAISSISASETRSLEVSHLAVIVLGNGIDRARFEMVLDFCKRNEELSISAMLISASNARTLLSSPDASGYKLTGVITSERESSSFGREARLYRVLNSLLSSDPVFFLPHFIARDGGFELYGGKIYRGGEPLTLLNRTESAYYMMMRGLFDRGILGGDAPGLSGSVGISDCRTTYIFSEEGGDINLLVRVSATLDSEIADDEYADKITSAAEENMKLIYESLFSLHGDVFGFCRAARKKGIAEEELMDKLRVSFECTKKG